MARGKRRSDRKASVHGTEYPGPFSVVARDTRTRTVGDYGHFHHSFLHQLISQERGKTPSCVCVGISCLGSTSPLYF